MAGDWIKMGKDLLTHPKVVRMSSALRADKLRTVGGLFAVWCLFDTHSIDGQLSGYTAESIDEEIRFPGFCAAMQSVNWLECNENGASLPDFEEHNGQSAKRRAQETERKRADRKASASDADKKRTREEKRREEKKDINTDHGFAAFWAVFPNKKAKQDAFKAWVKLNPCDALQASILKAIEIQSQGEDWRKEGGRFVPHPATWLNGKRWEDVQQHGDENRMSKFAGAI